MTQPFLKWAGGKRQLLPELSRYVPKFKTYFEPFVGGGALLFYLQPPNAVINDINPELYNCYQVIKDSIVELISELQTQKNTKEHYYHIRSLDRQKDYESMSPIKMAARIIFLNKTCYNGLFRVNRQGQFNVPFGYYKNPKIVDKPVLMAINEYLSGNNVKILNEDFENAVIDAQKGDFIYFDPPYDPLSDTSSFTSYSINGFYKNDQRRLRNVFGQLDKKGCMVLLSNSSTNFIYELYKDFNIVTVCANRSINSIASGRGKINEVLIMNYVRMAEK